MVNKPRMSCPDCGVMPGQIHVPGCDVERCPACGSQWLSCECDIRGADPLPWTGIWPGEEECYNRGYVCPDGSPDLNRLHLDGWNSVKRTWKDSSKKI